MSALYTLVMMVAFSGGISLMLSSVRDLRERWAVGKDSPADKLLIGWWICHSLLVGTQLVVETVEKGGIL